MRVRVKLQVNNCERDVEVVLPRYREDCRFYSGDRQVEIVFWRDYPDRLLNAREIFGPNRRKNNELRTR
jgi:hypothetical protein